MTRSPHPSGRRADLLVGAPDRRISSVRLIPIAGAPEPLIGGLRIPPRRRRIPPRRPRICGEGCGTRGTRAWWRPDFGRCRSGPRHLLCRRGARRSGGGSRSTRVALPPDGESGGARDIPAGLVRTHGNLLCALLASSGATHSSSVESAGSGGASADLHGGKALCHHLLWAIGITTAQFLLFD